LNERRQPSSDYIDADVAYFLGMLTSRGEISQAGGVRRIKIEFPFKNLEVTGITKSYRQKNEIIVGLQKSIARISELTESHIIQSETKQSVILTIESIKNSIFWRNIRFLMKGRQTYYEFEIPTQVYESDDQIKAEFMRGYCDVGATAREANRDQVGRHRVFLDVMNPNWKLPVELCHLLQDHLRVPVQTIDYGHPNMRDPKGKDYRAGKTETWAREHQIKVYCEEFEKVGFYMPHKQEILEELADYNKKNFNSPGFCNPPKGKGKRKYRHPGEKSAKLPKDIRGKHYVSYWQICGDLGCPRQSKCLPIFKPYMKGRQTALKTPMVSESDDDV